MLYLHPTSTCDVCLEKYSWDEPDAPRPHAIRCGHVFCMQCLDHLRPKVCPLCRGIFNGAYKLHIDTAADESHLLLSTDDIEARRLAEKVADVSGENSEDDMCKEVIDEVLTWLENFPMDAQKVLRALVSLLHRWRILHGNLQENVLLTQRYRLERNDLRERLTTCEREREEERVEWRRQSANVVSRMTELTQTYETKIIDAEMKAKRLEAELSKLERANGELSASLEEVRDAPPVQPVATLPVPAPAPAPSTELVASSSNFRTQPTTSAPFRYSQEPIPSSPPRTHNPLPPPPVPVPISLLPDFARPEKYRRRTRNRERDRDREHATDTARERVPTRDGTKTRTGDRDRERDRVNDRGGTSTQETRVDRTTSVRASWYNEIPVHESELSQDDRDREARRQGRQQRHQQERRHTDGNFAIYPASHVQAQAYAPPLNHSQSFSHSQSHYDDSTLPQLPSFSHDNLNDSLMMPRPKLPVPVDVYEGMALASNNRDSGGESGRDTDRERERRAMTSSVLADTSYAQQWTDRDRNRERRKESAPSMSRRASHRGVGSGGNAPSNVPASGSNRRMASMPDGYNMGQERRRDQEYQTSQQQQVSGSYTLYYPQYVQSTDDTTTQSYAPANSSSNADMTTSSKRRGTQADGYDASYLSTNQSQSNAQSQPRIDHIDRIRDRLDTSLAATRGHIHMLHPSGSFDSPRVRRIGVDPSSFPDPSSGVSQARPRLRTMSHAQSQSESQTSLTKTERRRSLLDQLVDDSTSSQIREPMPRRGAAIAEERPTDVGADESFVTRTHTQPQPRSSRRSASTMTGATRATTTTGTSRRERMRGEESMSIMPAVYRLQDTTVSTLSAYNDTSQTIPSTRAKTREGARTRDGERARDRERSARGHDYERYPGGYVPAADLSNASGNPERKPTPPQPPRSENIVYMARTPTVDAFPFTTANMMVNGSSNAHANRDSGSNLNLFWLNYANGPAEASSSTLVLPYVSTTGVSGIKEGEEKEARA